MIERARYATNFLRGTAAGVVTLLVVGVPTDVIDTPWFGREVPVRWWEYPVLAATAVLTALWFGIRSEQDQRATAPLTGVMLAVFAVGCPVCNKLILLAIGTSGALGFWGPIQPVLAAISLAVLAAAVVLRRRRSLCGPACAAQVGQDRADAAQPPSIAQ